METVPEKKLGMTSCLKALIVTWQCYNNSISCFEAAMKCKVWLTLICPMPNHQLLRCKRLDGGPQHTARCCRCTLSSSPIVCTMCTLCCAHCAHWAVCSCCAAAGAETTKEKEEWDTADQRDTLLVALTLFSLCDGNLNSTPSFAFICSPEKKREGRRWGRQRRRMDKSSSLVIDPPDGGCRVSFLSQERKFYLSINGPPDTCFWLSLFFRHHKAFNWGWNCETYIIQAWFVMVCSFLVNGIVFSIINTFGILFVKVGMSESCSPLMRFCSAERGVGGGRGWGRCLQNL